MRLRIVALLTLLVLALAACGDGDETTSTGPGGEPGDPPATATLDAQVIVLAEGAWPIDGPPVRVLDPSDPEAAAALFVEDEHDAVIDAVGEADVDGRTLLGGVVHSGCFPAGGVSVAVVDDGVVFTAEDVDEDEGHVECYRAIVTSALVSVATDDLPAGLVDEGPTEPTGPSEPSAPAPPGDDEVPGEVVLIEPARHESGETPGPGLVRDRVDLEALLGRYDAGEPDPALLARLESGAAVLVAGAVSGGCELPSDAAVVRTGTDLELELDYPAADPDLVCDEAVSALVLVAVDPADVEDVETVAGAPADGPTGVGVIQAVEPLDVEAEPLAARLADTDVAGIPGAPDLDLPPVAGDAVRLVFVVEACEPDTAELIADQSAGTVRAEAQQSGPPVDCDALAPYLVVADLSADHADLDPVTD